MFTYAKKVQFYETDLMGIVHHSNYIRYFEEARVAWAHRAGLLDFQKPESARQLAVIETRCQHLKPTFFGDELEIRVQVKAKGVRIFFQYQIHNKTKYTTVAVGMSVHAPMSPDLKVMRIHPDWKTILEKEQWTETWLSNS